MNLRSVTLAEPRVDQFRNDVAVQDEARSCLMLLLLGELGRVADLSASPDAESCILSALHSAPDDVKATAALALGGLAVCNPSQHLPLLLDRVRNVRGDASASASQHYLLLKALNELLRSLLHRGEALSEGATARIPLCSVMLQAFTWHGASCVVTRACRTADASL